MSSIYTESDEISMVFRPVDRSVPDATLIFGGKTAKLISLTAGYCSARFNFHLAAQVTPDTPQQVILTFIAVLVLTSLQLADLMRAGQGHFDSRVFTLPEAVECVVGGAMCTDPALPEQHPVADE